jgi:hypothetical protein
MAIWAWIGGLEHFGQPGNHIGPILLGLGGHMVNSMVAGVLFVAVLTVRAAAKQPGGDRGRRRERASPLGRHALRDPAPA